MEPFPQAARLQGLSSRPLFHIKLFVVFSIPAREVVCVRRVSAYFGKVRYCCLNMPTITAGYKYALCGNVLTWRVSSTLIRPLNLI